MSFAKGKKGGASKDSNRQDKKKAQEKAQIYEEFEGQDLDSIQQDFEDALSVSIKEKSSGIFVMVVITEIDFCFKDVS